MKKLAIFFTVSILSISSFTVFAAIKKSSIYNISEILKLVSNNYDGDITKIDLESKKNSLYYEVDVINNNKKTEIVIDAKTGKILKTYQETLDEDEKYISENFTQDVNLKASTTATAPTKASLPKDTKVFITEEKAKKIALDKVGGGKVVKSKLDYSDKVVEYEIEIIFGDYEYDIDIDASTGEILSFDKDHIYD